jgi:CBS domain-containing protein
VPMPEHDTHRDLRALTVDQAMRTGVLVARLDEATAEIVRRLEAAAARALPVVDDTGRLQGIVGRRELERAAAGDLLTIDAVQRDVVTVFSDQSLDLALLKLGRHAVRQAPVVARLDPERVIGMLSLEDISAAVGRTHRPPR